MADASASPGYGAQKNTGACPSWRYTRLNVHQWRGNVARGTDLKEISSTHGHMERASRYPIPSDANVLPSASTARVIHVTSSSGGKGRLKKYP